MAITQPLIISTKRIYDINCKVRGGGASGQAGAIAQGISKAVRKINIGDDILRKYRFVTRDSRKVERKKYGKAKARKGFQFSKR